MKVASLVRHASNGRLLALQITHRTLYRTYITHRTAPETREWTRAATQAGRKQCKAWSASAALRSAAWELSLCVFMQNVRAPTSLVRSLVNGAPLPKSGTPVVKPPRRHSSCLMTSMAHGPPSSLHEKKSGERARWKVERVPVTTAKTWSSKAPAEDGCFAGVWPIYPRVRGPPVTPHARPAASREVNPPSHSFIVAERCAKDTYPVSNFLMNEGAR